MDPRDRRCSRRPFVPGGWILTAPERHSGAPRHLAAGKPADEADFILRRRHRAVMERLPAFGGTLLDFGCGNGAQTRLFAPHFERAIGVDVDRSYVREAPRDQAMAVLYDGGRLPIRDACVDTVVSFEVLEHVGDEQLALREIRRVLRPGAHLALSVPNRWWVFETHGADLPVLPWNRVPFFGWLPKRVHDRWARARNYRRREIVEKIRRAGMEVVSAEYLTAPMDVIPWRALKAALRSTIFRSDTTALPVLATAVLVIARRPDRGPGPGADSAQGLV